MNRRVVLIDQNEVTDYAKYYGCGLGQEIYTLQYLNSLSEGEVDKLLNFGESDAILLVKGEAFKYLQKKYHFGIRSENYFDCTKLRRLSIEGGAYVKCVDRLPGEEEIKDFLSIEFTVPADFSWFKQKILHTFEESMIFLDWIDSLPIDEDLGFDYETSGMPLDKVFFLSGASICNCRFGGFISFTDIRRTATPEQYSYLLKRLGDILFSRMSHVWAYNMQYEFQVSHRELGVDLYNLCDASVVNVLDGDHLKKYSLKWTAQKVLDGVRTWDVDFDKLSDLMDSMFYEVVGKLKRDKKKVFKVTLQTYKNTDEWRKICSLYPKYIGEFEKLIQEYWGYPFMCVPSDILGYYCNLDSFYTLMIYKYRENVYSKEAFQTFLDNIRLGARLHSGGLYIDEDYRLQYQHECHKMMAWGITYCAAARCKIKMKKHRELMSSIERYNNIAKILLNNGRFFNGDVLEITKYLLLDNLDRADFYDSGINEGSLRITYGEEFSEIFMQSLSDSMKEVKYKGKIDENVKGKRKFINILSEKLKPYLGLDKLKIGNKDIELEKFIYYEKAYNELMSISNTQLCDIENIPDTITGFGTTFTLLDYSNYISDNYFKCKSPKENDEIVTEMFSIYTTETAFVAALSESVQQLPGEKNFYKNLGITSIEKAYDHFMEEWKTYLFLEDPNQYSGPYPLKMFNLAIESWRNGIEFTPAKDVFPVKDVWADFLGYNTQAQFFESFNSQYELYGLPFSEKDLDGNFFFLRKFTINYLLYKKYSKVLSTYIDGMFKTNNKWVIEGEDHIPLREADPGEPGAVEKCFVHYEVNTKSSKRWSSGFHTIISHSDLKDCITIPYHYEFDNNGNKIKVEESFIETYFDISSAEVKSAGFASGDPNLIKKFQEGEDIYIYSAKLYLGDEFDKLSPGEKKMWRKRFKTIFLGVLYGLGKKSLAERLNCSEQEADKIIQGLYTSFPKLREYVAVQQQFPLEHGGYINTMLGDRLKVQEYTWYLDAATMWEKKNLEARIQRLGVNLPIQGGTSSIMACGFMNNIRVSKLEGWKNPLQPIIVVH